MDGGNAATNRWVRRLVTVWSAVFPLTGSDSSTDVDRELSLSMPPDGIDIAVSQMAPADDD